MYKCDVEDRTSIVVSGSIDRKVIYKVEPFQFPSAEDAWVYAHGKFWSKLDTYYWVVELSEPSEEDLTKTVHIPTQMILYGIRN